MDDLILDLERRSKLQRLLRTVPGFRKGIWWHQLIAVLYDIALLFFLIVAMTTAHSLLDALCTFGFFFFGYARAGAHPDQLPGLDPSDRPVAK